MKLDDQQMQFIQAWGNMGSNWGINKTMAQIHGLLLISEEVLSTEEIMDTLNISRGNANMNLRSLLDWGLAYKESKSGDRKDYFAGEKDIWQVMTKIIRERRKRELEPMLNLLRKLKSSKKDDAPYASEFDTVISDISLFAENADLILSKVEKTKRKWFLNKMMKLFN